MNDIYYEKYFKYKKKYIKLGGGIFSLTLLSGDKIFDSKTPPAIAQASLEKYINDSLEDIKRR
jgi:hypothetical protein